MKFLVAYFRITSQGQNPSRDFIDEPLPNGQVVDKNVILQWESSILNQWNHDDPKTPTAAIRVFSFQPL